MGGAPQRPTPAPPMPTSIPASPNKTYGPISGQHELCTGSGTNSSTDFSTRNFEASVRVFNPSQQGTYPWSFYIAFRNQYVLEIGSGATWILWHTKLPNQPIGQGALQNLNSSAPG